MKKIFKVAIIMSLTFLIIKLESEFKNKSIFNISQVVISQTSPTLSIDLEKVKQELLGKNINNIDLKELKEKLLKDVRIENINIEKKNINKIKIDVEERKSEFYVQYKDKLYTMSKDGVVFGRIDEYPKQSMPILNLKDSKNKDRLILILEKIKDLDFLDEISQIYVINKNLVCLVLVDGTRIKTNINVTRDKYKIVMNLYNELKKNEKIEYIDARFKDIFIKEEEGNNAR
ncbi:cell division protein FtsQ/DivIB [uncultured Cetobacterium sp.]|uniref:cell division protein FtsQ/DivIB n=1 Tax=uncultured Cetobacterium sp. TaxID=527638 RepID=UPI002602E365|nr:cell division protein FtsQ/DivIB [uncultured Cetobacterium sp.]